jgi:hypothetical protein
MSNRTRWQVPAIVACSLAAVSATVASAQQHPATTTTPEQLQQQVESLQQQINALRAQQDQAATQAAQKADIDRVMQDAAGRSAPASLQATATDFTAGYKSGKFIIQSADGSFSINPNLQLQVRNVTNIRDTGDDTITENGFELRRAKLGFAGNVFSKDLTYEFLFEVPRNSGAVNLQDAWARYRFAPSWLVRLGQFKNPLGKEQTGSSKRLLAAERSLLNELLINGDDYIQGASLIYAPEDGPLRVEVAGTDGTLQSNTNFRDVSGTTPDTRPNWGAAGRAEYQIIGKGFKGYDDYSAMNQPEPLLVVGGGVDFTEDGTVDSILTYTVDAQFETGTGFGLFGAMIGRSVENFNGAGDDADDIGFLVQASQMLGVTWAKAEWEVFGRYDITILDDERVADPFDDQVHEITVGLNGYFRRHASKVTIDFTYLPNGSPSTADSAGIISSPEDQFVIRAQYQLLI